MDEEQRRRVSFGAEPRIARKLLEAKLQDSSS